MSGEHATVSFDNESLILVDPEDRVLGSENKARCHDGAGILHRAFSVFLFDERGATLLQQRSASKRLWPLFWSNSCCSHPRQGEAIEDAAQRRVREELGVAAALRFLFKFQYQASYEGRGAENELCSVLVGRLEGDVRVNANEIAATRLVTAAELDRELDAQPGRFTPWFKLEWARMRAEFLPAVLEGLAPGHYLGSMPPNE